MGQEFRFDRHVELQGFYEGTRAVTKSKRALCGFQKGGLPVWDRAVDQGLGCFGHLSLGFLSLLLVESDCTRKHRGQSGF